MPYRIAGIDVHKKMLAVVVADAEVEGDYYFERLKVGTPPSCARSPTEPPAHLPADVSGARSGRR